MAPRMKMNKFSDSPFSETLKAPHIHRRRHNVYLSIHPSIYSSIHPSIHLSIYKSGYSAHSQSNSSSQKYRVTRCCLAWFDAMFRGGCHGGAVGLSLQAEWQPSWLRRQQLSIQCGWLRSPTQELIDGWWFGTSILFSHILEIIIPIDFHIFQRGGPTTNQW